MVNNTTAAVVIVTVRFDVVLFSLPFSLLHSVTSLFGDDTEPINAQPEFQIKEQKIDLNVVTQF